MKTLILLLLITASAFAQATTVAVRVAGGATQTITLPAALASSLTAFAATQQTCTTATPPVCTPKYADIGALIIDNLKTGLFASVVEVAPAGAVATAKAAADTARANYEAAKRAALP